MIDLPALAQIVDRAYEVFKRPAPNNLGVCTACCMNFKDESALLTLPLPETPVRLIVEWIEAAFTSAIFPEEVTAYLAPRLLDALMREEIVAIETELVLERGLYGDCSRWSGEQAEVLDDFRFHYLDAFRKDEERANDLDDVLCMFARALWPMQESLEQLETWSDTELVNRMWRSLCGKAYSMSPFWHGAPVSEDFVEAQRNQVLNWYQSPKLRERVETVFLEVPENSEFWSRAADLERALSNGVT